MRRTSETCEICGGRKTPAQLEGELGEAEISRRLPDPTTIQWAKPVAIKGTKFPAAGGFYIVVNQSAPSTPLYVGKAEGGISNRMRQYSGGPKQADLLRKTGQSNIADLQVWVGMPDPPPYSTWATIEHAIARVLRSAPGNTKLRANPLRAVGGITIKNIVPAGMGRPHAPGDNLAVSAGASFEWE